MPIRVTVHFIDGEQLTGEAQQVALDRGGFTLSGPGGNTRSVWVGASAVKYVVIHPRRPRKQRPESDPRAETDLGKVVLHFLDGEILHSYEDEVFAPQPGGFTLRIWDAEQRELVKALVSGPALKGLFFVEEWDSRADGDKRAHIPPDDATIAWIDQAVAAHEARSVAVEAAEPGDAGSQGPLLVEEPSLLPDDTAIVVVAAEPALASEAPDEDQLPIPAEFAAIEEAPLVSAPSSAEQILAIVVSDAEERRPSFRSALTPRRLVVSTLPSPEEQRYNQLRARIAEVLSHSGPGEHEEETDEDPPAGGSGA